MWHVVRMSHRTIGLTVSAVLLLAGCAQPQPSYGFRHTSGLMVLPQTYLTPLAAATGDAAVLLAEAQRLAAAYPDDFGFPWTDPTSGAVIVDVVTDAGQRRAADVWPAGADLTPVRTHRVRHSVKELTAIRLAITDLVDSGVRDGRAILGVVTDFPHNRVIVDLRWLNDPLLTALATRFGTESIAIRVARADLD